MKEKLGGLSESQQGLNEATQRMLQQLQGKGRLSRTDEQRLQQMAAQQEMIRQGLEGLQRDYAESKELLGDMDSLAEQMKEIERQLQQNNVDRPLLERQAQILSRMLDAQRSIRQQEMSPERESRTGTLAERQSPPPIPPQLLRRERSLEEDVLRGADDKYPAQFRKLVEEYFRALSRESRTP
jgi:chromosome segregation ATPase